MKTLFLAWQAPSRAWFPIGRLDVDREKSEFCFAYTRGAQRAKREEGFHPLTSFPDFHERYESDELFPLFKNRVLDPHRKDFLDNLRSLDLDPAHPDPVEILAVSGGERQTDSFDVFPKLEKGKDNRFSCRFFLHGLRHVSEAARERALVLTPEEPLQVSLELNNPATRIAIQLTTRDYHFVGWTPRYLVGDLVRAVNEYPEIKARVVRNNEVGTPLNRRILVELSGLLPPDHKLMSGQDFQIIH
jgi:hypothetical protein